MLKVKPEKHFSDVEEQIECTTAMLTFYKCTFCREPTQRDLYGLML